MTFQQRVKETIESQHSLLCVGLDTDIQKIPQHLLKEQDPVFAFNKAIINATAEFSACFKINTAFYESQGAKGWETLQKTFEYLPKECPSIADAKRGDIGNTSLMYAKAIFEFLNADAITVNPLMGFDSVKPFLGSEEKGVFLLCLTSNPGSNDFQHFSDGQQKLYEKIAVTACSWNKQKNIGLVVGATHPDELKNVRSLAPDLPFLIPGIGAQGGDLEGSVLNGTDELGGNALFNSSRAIIYASSDKNFAQAAADAAKKSRDALNQAKRN